MNNQTTKQCPTCDAWSCSCAKEQSSLAFDEGIASFAQRPVSNPYPADSTEWHAWQCGYIVASDGAWDTRTGNL